MRKGLAAPEGPSAALCSCFARCVCPARCSCPFHSSCSDLPCCCCSGNCCGCAARAPPLPGTCPSGGPHGVYAAAPSPSLVGWAPGYGRKDACRWSTEVLRVRMPPFWSSCMHKGHTQRERGPASGPQRWCACACCRSGHPTHTRGVHSMCPFLKYIACLCACAGCKIFWIVVADSLHSCQAALGRNRQLSEGKKKRACVCV